MKILNKNKESYDKDYSKITNAYIAGIFDAEGNVYLNDTKRLRFYVKITQKCDPLLIEKIKEFLKFGNIYPSENYRIRFESKINVIKFYEIVKDFINIKKEKFEILINRLTKNWIFVKYCKLRKVEINDIMINDE